MCCFHRTYRFLLASTDNQARELLAPPGSESLKGKRDRAILSTLLFHALRRDELCKLKVRDARHAFRSGRAEPRRTEDALIAMLMPPHRRRAASCSP